MPEPGLLLAALLTKGAMHQSWGCGLPLFPVTCACTCRVFSFSLSQQVAQLCPWGDLGMGTRPKKIPEGTQGTMVIAWDLGVVKKRDGQHTRAGAEPTLGFRG